MIDRIYTNSTDPNLYATLDAALAVYGHRLKDGKIVPNGIASGDFDAKYTYNGDLSDFHNGRDVNGRLSFTADSPTAELFGNPRYSTAFIGFSMLHGHQEATKAENKAIRTKQEAITMSALAAFPEAVFGDLRDPETNSSIRSIIERISERPGVADVLFLESENREENRKYEARLFRSFLVRAYNFMGTRTEEEQAHLESFTG